MLTKDEPSFWCRVIHWSLFQFLARVFGSIGPCGSSRLPARWCLHVLPEWLCAAWSASTEGEYFRWVKRWRKLAWDGNNSANLLLVLLLNKGVWYPLRKIAKDHWTETRTAIFQNKVELHATIWADVHLWVKNQPKLPHFSFVHKQGVFGPRPRPGKIEVKGLWWDAHRIVRKKLNVWYRFIMGWISN